MIEVGMLVIQLFALIALIWYVIETRRLRLAAQQQVEVSQELIKAAMDQVEGLSKPCLTLGADLRDQADAILKMDDAAGSTIACSNEGNFVVQNIGNGVALNVKYSFTPINTHGSHPSSDGYLQNVLASQKVRMAEPVLAFRGEYEVIFQFQSIGGRKYESTVMIKNRVLTAFKTRATV